MFTHRIGLGIEEIYFIQIVHNFTQKMRSIGIGLSNTLFI